MGIRLPPIQLAATARAADFGRFGLHICMLLAGGWQLVVPSHSPQPENSADLVYFVFAVCSRSTAIEFWKESTMLGGIGLCFHHLAASVLC